MDDASNAHDDTGQPQGEPGEDGHSRNLRTILLLDICDSTGIVERLGDTATAQLFREHDRLVLRLQQAWRGRLIDRSDGLLLLFERPMDGLGFALDYGQGLAGIGKLRDIELKARAGLHVGELLTWRNSEESVRLGAKPLEVEGLAKPMAARLMSIARPGQILMSAVAESLTHRAVRDMGERGLALVWKSHGRWRFKGMPETQEVFEVGEPGIAPLRRPIESAKAQRAVPLWRRPTAMAAEAALVAAIAVGGWFATRPPPAIAFNERDWVVVGDLRNLTGDARLEDSLEQAFRISLEQSRHVNVLSDLKVRDTLARMRLAPDTVVDRDIAAQIAQRDGARAVLLPTVSEVGGRLRMSVEVVDPATQTTVYAHVADGKGEASVLASIDEVTGALRADLGEAIAQIDRDSKPLPEVTTGNLDALRAYALGQEAYVARDYGRASDLYELATELDPDFASAWVGSMRVHYARMEPEAATRAMEAAKSRASGLPRREAMYLSAWASEFDAPSEATGKWIELAELYPDYFPGLSNAAMWLFRENRFAQSLKFAHAATVPQNPLLALDYDSQGRALLALGREAEARSAFDESLARSPGSSLRRRMAVDAASRDFEAARSLAARFQAKDRHSFIERTSLLIDEGRWSEASEMATRGLRLAEKDGGFDARSFLVVSATAMWLDGQDARAGQLVDKCLEQTLPRLERRVLGVTSEDDASLALAAALVAQRLRNGAPARKVRETLEAYPEVLAFSTVSNLLQVVAAEQLRLDGNPRQAVEILAPLVQQGNEPFQARVVLQNAYIDLGVTDEAVVHSKWLQAHRGYAYVDYACSNCLQPLNVADSSIALLRESEALQEVDADKAKEALREFKNIWPESRVELTSR